MDGWHQVSMAELASLLRSGELSAREATEHALARIARFDGRDGLHAFLNVASEHALASATLADERRAAGQSLGPLDGIPVALKDLIDTVDMPTTAGSAALRDRQPGRDASLARSLRSAGAVLLGKTNMMEFAYGHPHPDVGETKNPWNPERTAGGSSGGSAAAVAAGMAWAAIGSDTGGSIRSPAAYCGVTGLKPTYGLVSCSGVIPLSWSLDHVGPMARTALDCAMLLRGVAGHDPADPYSMHAADAGRVTAELDALLADPSLDRPLRVAVVPRMFEPIVTPGLDGVVRDAVGRLPEAGLEVVELDLPRWVTDAVLPTISKIYPVEAAAYHAAEFPDRWGEYGPALRAGLEEASRVSALEYVDAQRARLALQRAFAELYARVDLVAWPAQPLVAPPLGTTDAVVGGDDDHATTIEVEIRATGPANLVGEPAISIPCGFVDGMPVGLHLQGPRLSDALVLRAAIAYQRITGDPPVPALD